MPRPRALIASQPARQIRDQLDALDLLSSPSCRPGQECFEEKIAKARRLLEEYPNELQTHRTLQDLLRFNALIDSESWELAKSEYADRSAAAPDDPVALYLHLRNETPPGGQCGRMGSAARSRPGLSFRASGAAVLGF